MVQCLCLKLFTHLAGLCWRRKDAAQQHNQEHGACTLPGALGKHHGSLRKQKFTSRREDLSWMQPERVSLSFLFWPTCLYFAQEVESPNQGWCHSKTPGNTLHRSQETLLSKKLPPSRATRPNYHSRAKKYCWLPYNLTSATLCNLLLLLLLQSSATGILLLTVLLSKRYRMRKTPHQERLKEVHWASLLYCIIHFKSFIW